MPVDLIQAMESFGLVVDHPPRFDGVPVRYSLAGKKSKSGFCIGHERDGKHYAVFGSWVDRSQDKKWTDNGIGTDHCNQQFAQLAKKASEDREKKQRYAAIGARKAWEKAAPANGHQYLDDKAISAHGCRVSGDILLVPIYDSAGELVNLQRIYPDGTKKFLFGGKISGCCFPIDGKTDRIYIVEGFATGATVRDLTECKTLVAFNAGNLKAVAKTARETWPDKRIIIAADNDHATDGNPGLKYATEAAEAIGAEVATPECPPGTDFNDMASHDPVSAKSLLVGQSPIKSLSISRIMSTTYRPIKWVVEGIIPEGLTLLAGKPKFGKSWLMLGLAYAVANGLPAWGYGKTTRGSVYYLALEDSPRRIQDRVLTMEGYFDTYPDNLHIVTDFPKLGQGFVEEIQRIIDTDRQLGCIIVDTLQKVRPHSGQGKRNLYQAEYEDFESLQKIAIANGAPIIAIHHTRKKQGKGQISENPIDEISGSTGIQGVADTIIVCQREGNNGVMHVTGREVNEDDYPMEFVRTNMTWLLSDPQDKEIDVGPLLLSDWFKTQDHITAKEAAEMFKINQRTAKRRLNKLVEEGKLMLNKSDRLNQPDEYRPTRVL